MWLSRDNSQRGDSKHQLVAVAVDKDKGSQIALKWAIDNLLCKGQTVILVHVKLKNQGILSLYIYCSISQCIIL